MFFLLLLFYFFKPSKNEGREKIEKVKKNGEANVPSGRPTQNLLCNKTELKRNNKTEMR